MIIFQYNIKLIDPLFYSREGLGGAVTPIYIHATAINHAVAYAVGAGIDQPYIMAENNGGRNTPRYASSHISQDFYFTPARLKGNPSYLQEIAKGELDGFVRKGYPGAEVLRASHLFSLVPETKFEGYGYIKDSNFTPKIIRLGSFRGKAKLTINFAKFLRPIESGLVDHPTDPLVCKTSRGVMINMFPYPVIENAVCETCYKIRVKKSRFPNTISLPISSAEVLTGDIQIAGETLIL